jgi:hypothetical protein
MSNQFFFFLERLLFPVLAGLDGIGVISAECLLADRHCFFLKKNDDVHVIVGFFA